jgi:hypothetical protein
MGATVREWPADSVLYGCLFCNLFLWLSYGKSFVGEENVVNWFQSFHSSVHRVNLFFTSFRLAWTGYSWFSSVPILKYYNVKCRQGLMKYWGHLSHSADRKSSSRVRDALLLLIISVAWHLYCPWTDHKYKFGSLFNDTALTAEFLFSISASELGKLSWVVGK